jgi:hypothetical protein
MNMPSGVNVSACYQVKHVMRMHEGCRLCMTCRPEIWTRQIDDTGIAFVTPDVCGGVRKRQEIRKPEGNGWDSMTAVAIV